MPFLHNTEHSETTTPATPASGRRKIYPTATGWKDMDDAGTELQLATVTGTETLTNKTLTSPDINTPDIDGGTADNVVIGGATPAAGTFTVGTLAQLVFTASTELTIASGAVSAGAKTFYTIDTEADASSDDLDTISGGTAGELLVIRANNAGRTVVVTTAGNIVTPDAASVTLDETYKMLWLLYDGDLSKWVIVGGSGSGGGASSTAVSFSFSANGSAYYVATATVTLTTATEGGSGTLAYAVADSTDTTTFSADTLPITLDAGDVLRVTVSSISGYKAVTLTE